MTTDDKTAKRKMVEELRDQVATLRRALMTQPDYTDLIIQLGEALESKQEFQKQAALKAYAAWQEGDI